MMEITDTIAAVSTPRGKGGIAVIRISGADAREVLSRVFAAGVSPAASARRAVYGKILGEDGGVIDEGIATFFAAPASFTGEDVAEIACHGGILLTEAVLASVFHAGARPARAGEFTRRAVMNGKMTLSAAEALGSLLDAAGAGQLALARGGMAGHLSGAVQALYDRVGLLLADAYAKIDFPDEDLNTKSTAELIAEIGEIGKAVEKLLATYRTGHAVGEGVRTVICGAVNAGKSTLYNALVGHNAAIVTDVAGTTRDILTETVPLGKVTLRLFDTAGLRESDDTVEKIGVSRAREAMKDAELVLAVFDASKEADAQACAFIAELQTLPGTVIAVLNKADRPVSFRRELLDGFAAVVTVSAAAGDIAPLREAVERLYLSDAISLSEDAVVSNARQYAALSRAAEALSRAETALREGVTPDAALIDAELSMAALGEVDGRAVDERIVENIFSHFCVGK